MKLAKILTDEADALILRLKQQPANMDDVVSRLTFTRSVSNDAYYAYLDGRVVRAKALNKLANKVRLVALHESIKPRTAAENFARIEAGDRAKGILR